MRERERKGKKARTNVRTIERVNEREKVTERKVRVELKKMTIKRIN